MELLWTLNGAFTFYNQLLCFVKPFDAQTVELNGFIYGFGIPSQWLALVEGCKAGEQQETEKLN